MLKLLQKASWTVALRGLVAVVFGVVLFAWPDISLTNVLKTFAIYAFLEGAVVVFGSMWYRNEHRDWPTLSLNGLFSMLVGIFIFARPELTELAFLYLIAARALVMGVLDIGISTQLRKEVKNELMVVLSGLSSVVFAGWLFANPAEGVIEMLWWISLYGVVHGLFWLAFAFGVGNFRFDSLTSGRSTTSHTHTIEEHTLEG